MNRFTYHDAQLQPVEGGSEAHVFTADHQQQLTIAVDFVGGKEVNATKAEKLVGECRLGGFEDWRQPTVEEEFLLRDRTRCDPAVDPIAFPRCPSAYGWVWTSTPAAWSIDEDTKAASAAWSVGLDHGDADALYRDGNGFVRAVRSGVPSSQ